MTSLRYYEVTYFLKDPNEICTAYVLVFIFEFLFSKYLVRKLRFITKITSIVQLPYTSFPPPIPSVPPIRVGSVRDTSFIYLRILFQHKKQNKKMLFTEIGEKQTRSPPPLWAPH